MTNTLRALLVVGILAVLGTMAVTAQTTNPPGIYDLTGVARTPGTLTNFLVVSKAGSDSSGQRNNAGLPFATIAGAVSNAVSGDTVVVYPGIYNDHDLLKTNVNFIGLPGADIVYVQTIAESTNSWGVFDDRHCLGGTTNTIAWPGRVIAIGISNLISIDNEDDNGAGWGTLAHNWKGTIVCTNPATQLKVNIGRLGQGAFGRPGSCVYHANGNGHSQFTVGEMYDPVEGVAYSNDFGYTVAAGTYGVTWEIGDCYFNVYENNADSTYSILWPEPQGLHTNSFYYTGHRVKSKLYGDSHSPGYRMWFDIKEIEMPANSTTGAGSIAVDCYGAGGKFYINAEKIGSFGTACVSTTGEGDSTTNQLQVWVTAQKISNACTNASVSGPCYVKLGAGQMWVNCPHYEDPNGVIGGASGSAGFVVNGDANTTRLVVGPGIAYTGSTNVLHLTGVARYNGMTFITTNGAPVMVGGAGLKLQNCVLVQNGVTGTSFKSPSAQTVLVYNGTVANVAKDANTTIGASGTLTVDTAVK
jgi:hypothetical protein